MNKSIKIIDCENDSLEEMLESTYKIYTKEQEKSGEQLRFVLR